MLHEKCYTCVQGLPHHMRDGSSIDPDHTCEESDVTVVLTNFLGTKEGNMVRWLCMTVMPQRQ